MASWFYGPNGESRIIDDEADVPKGWADHPSKVKSALDHDGDGKMGGSAKGEESTAAKGAAKRKAVKRVAGQ